MVMAKRTPASTATDGLLGAVRTNPATKRLAGAAQSLVEAQANRVVGKVGDGISSAAERLTTIGETGQLPRVGDGVKRLLHSDGPGGSVVGAARSGLRKATGGLLDKIKGGKGKGTGQAKAMNIEESIDIGVPVSTAYNQWTQFQDFSRFMKGVESVEQTSDTETTWRAKVFRSRRSWKATIQEQIPDRRIVWTSEGPKGSTKGVVTFHPLADDLTRVLVAIEYYPSGVVEKTGNLWRAAGRRTRLDLKNFRRFVMLEGEETGEWRGEIREGKVTSGPDEEDEEREERPRRRRPSSESGPNGRHTRHGQLTQGERGGRRTREAR
jgi:uncharacterized membrane protein